MADIIEKRSEATNLTPMMKQYLEIKEQYEDYILMYRLGDFYECFFDDALIASRVLELTLTSRDCGDKKRAAMCGVPFHKSDVYVARLVEKGYKVAICEQTEDPKQATGLVKREVTRAITPGTVTDGELLNSGKNNFLSAVCAGVGGVGLALADITTGELSATFIDGEDALVRVKNELAGYQPSEAIFNVKNELTESVAEFLSERYNTMSHTDLSRHFSYEAARERVRATFGDEREKIGEPETLMAVGAILSYIREMQKSDVSFAKEIEIYKKGQYLDLDMNTRRNLELVESMRNKEKRGSLLWVLDKTETSMGARMLRSWVLRPLVNPAHITRRQAAVRDLFENTRERDSLRELLSVMFDLERLTAKTVYGTANAKDLMAIAQSLAPIPYIKNELSALSSETVKHIINELDPMSDVCLLITDAICDNPPFSVREGKMIREGYDKDVDYYRSIKENGKGIMEEMEERERELTGIKTLRVTYNKVFGYYIEVTKSFIDQVPERYVRKQTLTNCERYITQELKEMETTILGAEDRLVNLEFELFTKIRNFVAENSERIRKTAALIAELDVYLSLATVASKNGYVCPEIDLSTDLEIKDGRHPVVEKFVTESYFVPNDTHLDTQNNRMMIITGPNMAGKSTYMRQVAIMVIMAQIGSFVPARDARMGIVDKVFTRVGASDDLAAGQSTFMLEMSEVATILKNATKRSLIIYDEVGRGTSTYDGMAIARAVVEYTHSKKIGAKTLFATHYHELVEMEDELEGVVNYNIAAKKRGDSIIFLRKIIRGGTDDSYGIEVAKLAGVPNEVVRRAREVLATVERAPSAAKCERAASDEPVFDLFTVANDKKGDEALEKIRKTDINTITPIEAMNLLFELKKLISD